MSSPNRNKPFLLEQVPLFQDLSAGEKDDLKKKLRKISFEKGQFLFSEGTPCERILIVQSGRVKMLRVSSTGREQILEVLGPGDTCACNPGELTWKCSLSARALTDGVAWSLERSHYRDMVAGNSRLMKTLTAIFAERLCNFCSLIEQVSLENPRRRVVQFLLDRLDAEEPVLREGLRVNLPFTHEEIAHRLGLARETVTRQLTSLKKSKLIEIHAHQVTICGRKALEKLLV
jgi:CRP/FNR family transcriptional regulator